MNYVYCLYDTMKPNVIAYIGCTCRPGARKKEHFSGRDSATRDWFELTKAPAMKIMATSKSRIRALLIESACIKKFNSILNAKRGQCRLSDIGKYAPSVPKDLDKLPDPLPGAGDSKNQIRLEPEIYDELVLIQARCPFSPGIGTLANEAAFYGIPKLKKICRSAPRKVDPSISTRKKS